MTHDWVYRDPAVGHTGDAGLAVVPRRWFGCGFLLYGVLILFWKNKLNNLSTPKWMLQKSTFRQVPHSRGSHDKNVLHFKSLSAGLSLEQNERHLSC